MTLRSLSLITVEFLHYSDVNIYLIALKFQKSKVGYYLRQHCCLVLISHRIPKLSWQRKLQFTNLDHFVKIFTLRYCHLLSVCTQIMYVLYTQGPLAQHPWR